MQLGTSRTVIASTDTPASTTTVAGSDFFGPDGPSFRDVLDAINPLEHIPFVSEAFDSAMDHKPSTASRLVGGAALGGPIGFVASLASVIFESQTGKGVGETMLAAIGGDDTSDTSTQYAENTAAAPVTAVTTSEQAASTQTASAAPAALPPASAGGAGSDQDVLALYGASTSAHRSYQKAQMLPYLRDVNTTQVL